MEKLIIEPTLNTPSVILDPEKNQFQFSGESRPENVRNFYLPVLEWLENFSADLAGGSPEEKKRDRQFHFNFEYFNSTSAKYILDLFKTLGNLHSDFICSSISGFMVAILPPYKFLPGHKYPG